MKPVLSGDEKRLECIALLLKGSPHVHRWLMWNGTLRQPYKEMLQESRQFSAGEQILIQVALDIWNQQGEARLADIVQRLDGDNFDRVLAALLYWRTI